ncbi:MAG: peptidoglycan DD-metalloendopeptidase family protein [Candidatus Limnocylindrales bacterium]
MLNASVGVQRVMGRLRRPQISEPPTPTIPETTLRVRSRSAARQVRDGMGAASETARYLPAPRPRRRLHLFGALGIPVYGLTDAIRRLGHERAVGLAVAVIVLSASFASVAPGAASGDTGGPTGDGPAPRIAVGGDIGDPDALGEVVEDYATPPPEEAAPDGAATAAYVDPASNVNALSRIVDVDATDPEAQAVIAEREAQGPVVEGPFLSDGTLLKPVAVNTSVADGSDLVDTYKVKAGDTLVGIAKAHGVTMMTLWWANKSKLDSKDDLHQGQVLRIPPVSGLVIEVKAGQTLASLATAHKVTEAKIIETNGLEDENLVVGQVLVLPGAKGEPIPTPKPAKSPPKSSGSSSGSGGGSSGGSSGGSARPPKTYGGGNFAWPAPGAGISQYYHYGHYGLDIDGNTGDSIVAAASGTVTFAGWKSNGGGYQVWIAHGSGLYTTYNHMSSVSVGRGQHVSRGQRVGRMGATGYATGSHLHFEVWKGPIWNGGRRVNPLAYL